MEFDARVGGGELPDDFTFGGVAGCFPGRDFAGQKRLVRDAAVETLAAADAQFRLGQLEPTAVFRRVVDFQICPRLSSLTDDEFLIIRLTCGSVIHPQLARCGK